MTTEHEIEGLTLEKIEENRAIMQNLFGDPLDKYDESVAKVDESVKHISSEFFEKPYEIVSPPIRVDKRYFNDDGIPNQRLIDIVERVKKEYLSLASRNEEIQGLYVVGSVARGDFKPESDLDIYIWAKVAYSRGRELANTICERINELSKYYPELKKKGIDLQKADKDLLIKKGLLEKGERPSLIKIIGRSGLIKKADMIDIIIYSVPPLGRVYDLEEKKWVKYGEYKEKDGKLNLGPISEYFRYGF